MEINFNFQNLKEVEQEIGRFKEIAADIELLEKLRLAFAVEDIFQQSHIDKFKICFIQGEDSYSSGLNFNNELPLGVYCDIQYFAKNYTYVHVGNIYHEDDTSYRARLTSTSIAGQTVRALNQVFTAHWISSTPKEKEHIQNLHAIDIKPGLENNILLLNGPDVLQLWQAKKDRSLLNQKLPPQTMPEAASLQKAQKQKI